MLCSPWIGNGIYAVMHLTRLYGLTIWKSMIKYSVTTAKSKNRGTDMTTLLEAYKLARPHIENDLFVISGCAENEAYFVFYRKTRDGTPYRPAGGGTVGVRKNDKKLCLIGFNMSKFCTGSWDFETGKIISDDIGKATREYSEAELNALVSSKE